MPGLLNPMFDFTIRRYPLQPIDKCMIGKPVTKGLIGPLNDRGASGAMLRGKVPAFSTLPFSPKEQR